MSSIRRSPENPQDIADRRNATIAAKHAADPSIRPSTNSAGDDEPCNCRACTIHRFRSNLR